MKTSDYRGKKETKIGMTKSVDSNERKIDARNKHLNKQTLKNREKYAEQRKIATKLCRRKKREIWNKKIEEIKRANIKNVRKFYKEVKETSKEYQQQNIIYKDDKGKILTEAKDILLRWQQYFQFLLENELQTREKWKEK